MGRDGRHLGRAAPRSGDNPRLFRAPCQMKLATLKDGTRDGCLIVVTRALARALKADHIAPTLQAALDELGLLRPQLEQLATKPMRGQSAKIFDLDPKQLMAPLPRAHQVLPTARAS